VLTDESHPTGFMLKEMAADGSDPEVEYFRRGSAASRHVAGDMPAPAAPSGGRACCT
jgi:2-dehydro-3-deoxygluconokinase